jgi:hypothetical protein
MGGDRCGAARQARRGPPPEDHTDPATADGALDALEVKVASPIVIASGRLVRRHRQRLMPRCGRLINQARAPCGVPARRGTSLRPKGPCRSAITPAPRASTLLPAQAAVTEQDMTFGYRTVRCAAGLVLLAEAGPSARPGAGEQQASTC